MRKQRGIENTSQGVAGGKGGFTWPKSKFFNFSVLHKRKNRHRPFLTVTVSGQIIKINNGRWPDSGKNAAQPDQRSGLFKGFGMLPNKQKRQFPVTPGIAVSSLCGNKDIACKVVNPPSTDKMFPLILVVTNCITTTFAKRSKRPLTISIRCGAVQIDPHHLPHQCGMDKLCPPHTDSING